MSAFRFIKGNYLLLLLLAVLLHILLALFAPDPNGYVWDFYSEAIRYTFENGHLPSPQACWVCYHPPLLPLIGSGIFHIVNAAGGSEDTQLFVVACVLNLVSLIFAIYTFALYKRFSKHPQLDFILWAFILFLPLRFITAFSIEADMLVATLIVVSLYYFSLYLDDDRLLNLSLACAFIALAALTKYTGLVIAILFAAVLAIRWLHQPKIVRLNHLAVFCMITVTLGGYPYVKNYINGGTVIIGNKAWQHSQGYYNYNFKDFSIPRIIEVFKDTRPIKLKHYYQYNSEVLNSLYGQLWTDFSFFTVAYRHGQHETRFIYKGKHMPQALLWAILLSGLIPVSVGIAGFSVMLFQSDKYLFNCVAIISLAVYIHWFMGHNAWMLKSKYLLYLLVVWIIAISEAGSIINPVILQKLLIPCVLFSTIYCFYFAVF